MAAISPPFRWQIEPLPQRQFSFIRKGQELTRWHFGPDSPRPFFYPVNGPSGSGLTRMGHPGAPNHDHHRSFWFAHHDLLGLDFWSENKAPQIQQSEWYAIEDGDDFARIAFNLNWNDGHDPQPILSQRVFVTARSVDADSAEDWCLDLQCDFNTESEGIEFRKSNFGVLGLRVAKNLSVLFGSGAITGSDGQRNERKLFGRPNRWIDYSGQVGTAKGEPVWEGMTLIDHSANPGHGTDKWASWHVRDDGWLGPSLSRHDHVAVQPGETLTCRYRLFVHAGICQSELVNAVADDFEITPHCELLTRPKPHHQWGITNA